uniref:UPF0497 membrane protein n=1 Tax=Solanum tuberosum TaxID=4113 RepID=M0ZIE7_SOLTU
MSELKAKAANERKDNATEMLAISGNLSLPQLDCQSSMRVAAEDDADIRRYVTTCHLEKY